MKNKKTIFFLALIILAATGLIINSCKKENQDYVTTLLTRGKWQLASVLVYNRIGTSIISVDTLNTNCDSTQIFSFSTNNTCTYTNFECIPQKTSGSWTFISNDGFLVSDMLCTDTAIGGAINPQKEKPFNITKIVNLGQYSMVLQTGDVNVLITATTRNRLVQYGFVHPSANSQ